MVALYDSFIYPFVALFSIPVAAIGAFLATQPFFEQFEFIRLTWPNYVNGFGG